MEEPPHLEPPIRVIGRYALYGKLASGGMATVHFGRLLGPAGFSRTVAIKRLHPQFAKDPEFVAMFLDEARLAARIQHPNVVATVDVVAQAEELFLVMDYIRGESFSRLLRMSRKKGVDVGLGTIASVISGMLNGLHAAHEAKDEHGQPLSVVHRDVSPQNVLIGVDGVTRVLDFGVAKAAARVQVTRDGQMKGKLAYMAPEQLSGKPVDRRTDIFAAGIVLWEALTSRRLFDADDAAEVLRMILSEEIPPPSAVVPSLPRHLDAIVMKALARDQALRYQTAREFAIALEETSPFSSTREVGEWVEKVAGETLLNREQAVAEIEAISAVSNVSIVTESSPAIMKTLDGRSSPVVRSAAKPPEEGATRVYQSAPPSVAKGATRAQVPRRRQPPPKPPPVPSRRGTLLGLGRVDEEKTSIFDRETEGAADDKTSIFDAEASDDKTSIFDAEASDDKTSIFDAEASDDKTSIFDKNDAEESDDKTSLYQSGDGNLVAPEPTQPANRRPPPPRPNSGILPAAGKPAPAPSVIIQEHTDPAMFRPRPGLAMRLGNWFWADATRRMFRVAVASGIVALCLGFGLVAGRGARRDRGTRVPMRTLPAPTQTAIPAVAPVASVAEEPRGIDPASLPPAPPEDAVDPSPPARAAPAATPRAPAAPIAPTTQVVEHTPEPRPHHAMPAKTAEASPAPPPAEASPTPPPAPAPAPRQEPIVSAPPSPPAQKASGNCKQPFAVDENGIRRIKPECL